MPVVHRQARPYPTPMQWQWRLCLLEFRKVMPKRERKGREVGVDGLLPFVRAMLDEERCDPARLQTLLEAA